MSQDLPPSPESPSPESPSPESQSVKPSAPSSKPSTLQQAKQVWQTVQPAAVKIGSTTVELGRKARDFWSVTQPKVQRWWSATLPKIRGILPQAWNDKLADWMITSGAIALLVMLFWITTSLLFPSRPVVAKAPPAGVIAPRNTSKSAPIDANKLTSIQNQLAEVAEPYAPELPTVPGMENPEIPAPKLIDWVQANPNRDLLMVQVADDWYELAAAQQDGLANDLFKRSLKLKFEQLELVDATGKSLARSPVVGSKMVVLRRSL
jgi:hypothetical protein